MASYDDGLICDGPASDLEPVPEQPPSAYADPKDQQHAIHSQPTEAPARDPTTICGMRRITFFLLVIIVILIIAGAVGGGVGGSLAVKNAQNAASKSEFVTLLSLMHKYLKSILLTSRSMA